MLRKILLIGFVMTFPLFAELQNGLYTLPSEKTMQLSLKDGTYRLRYEDAPEERIVLQEGDYRIDGNRIYFNFQFFPVGWPDPAASRRFESG